MGVDRIILNQEFKNDLITAYNELKIIDENHIDDWDHVQRLRDAKDALGKYVSEDDEVHELDRTVGDYNSPEYLRGRIAALEESKKSLEEYIGEMKVDLRESFRATEKIRVKYNI